MKKILMLILVVAVIFCIVGCGKQNATNGAKENSLLDKIQTAVSSPKDLIVGTWVLDDYLVDGKSSMTSEQRQKQEKETDVAKKIIVVFEKNKMRTFAMGQIKEGTYVWLDDKTIETTSINDGKTEKSKSTAEVTADKLTVYSESKADATGTTKKQVTIFTKYKGELPKATPEK